MQRGWKTDIPSVYTVQWLLGFKWLLRQLCHMKSMKVMFMATRIYQQFILDSYWILKLNCQIRNDFIQAFSGTTFHNFSCSTVVYRKRLYIQHSGTDILRRCSNIGKMGGIIYLSEVNGTDKLNKTVFTSQIFKEKWTNLFSCLCNSAF